MQMNLQASKVALSDGALNFARPAVDINGAGASTLVALAIILLRISAMTTILAPLFLIAWLVL